MRLELEHTGQPNYTGSPAGMGRPHLRRWLITDDAVRVTGTGYEQTWRWAAVRAVEQRPYAYLLWQRARVTIDVPRAALTAEQDAELQEFFRQHRFLRRRKG